MVVYKERESNRLTSSCTIYRNDDLSHTITVDFNFVHFRGMALWLFLCLFCVMYILVHSISHSPFMISSCNFIGMCIR